MKYARVRTGALIVQDFAVHQWQDNGEIFRVTKLATGKGSVYDSHCVLKRYGYGWFWNPFPTTDNAYGNGSISVKPEDLIEVPEEVVDVLIRTTGKDYWNETEKIKWER
jgi:hypothetical protein